MNIRTTTENPSWNHLLNRLVWLLQIGLLLSISSGSFASEVNVFDATLRAKSCYINSMGVQECVFDFGKELKFTIAEVDGDYAGTLFELADLDANGFYVKYGALHSCLIISHGDGNLFGGFGFVNPKTAGVFRTYQECSEDYK